MELQDLRQDYGKGSIRDEVLLTDPFEWFNEWLRQALNSGEPEANAMALSTVSPEGRPSSRIVLLKAIDKDGFVFFTNYESRKGLHLKQNPSASLLFFWPSLERQVRIEGSIVPTEPAVSDAYFLSRPLQSRISAAISPQSRPVGSRRQLELMVEDLEIKLNGESPERPANWGGYRLVPVLFEFWQGRRDRLHDRIQYQRENNAWMMGRLAP